MASRDTTNLKVLDDLPDHPESVKRWRIRFKYQDPKWKGGGHSRVCQRHYIGTLKEAQAERDHLRTYLRQGKDPADYPRPHEETGQAERPTKLRRGETTFSALYDRYKQVRQTEDVDDSTLVTEEIHMRNHIMPEIQHWVVQRINLRDFQDLRLEWHQRYLTETPPKKSPATVNSWIRTMKHFVSWCCRRLGIRHACRDLKLFPKPKTKRGRAIPPHEIGPFLEELQEAFPHYYALAYLGLFTGQRYGTLSALKWKDVDRANELLHFRRSQKNGEVKSGSKTGHITSAPLEPFLGVLEFHRETMKGWAPVAYEKGDWIFPAKGDPTKLKYGGLRTSTSTINRAYRVVCDSLGFEKITTHDFRRTFCTVVLNQGISKEVLRSLTGHSEEMMGHYYRQTTAAKGQMIGAVLDVVDVPKLAAR